jgi:hypothetical protein
MRKGEEGCETAGGNQVVSTRMTDAWKGIIFGVEVDDAAA